MKISVKNLRGVLTSEIRKFINEVDEPKKYKGRHRLPGELDLRTFYARFREWCESQGIEKIPSQSTVYRYFGKNVKKENPAIAQYMKAHFGGGEDINPEAVLKKIYDSLADAFSDDPQLQQKFGGKQQTKVNVKEFLVANSDTVNDFIEKYLIDKYAQETGASAESIVKSQEALKVKNEVDHLKKLADELEDAANKGDELKYKNLMSQIVAQEEKIARLLGSTDEETIGIEGEGEEEPPPEAYEPV